MLGERLRAARLELGYTQAALGAELHVADATINRYEQGVNNPSPEMLVRLAAILKVSVDYLLGRSALRQPDRIAETMNDYGVDPHDPEIAPLLRQVGQMTPEQRRKLREFIASLSPEASDT